MTSAPKKISLLSVYFTFFLDNFGLGIVYPIFTSLFFNPEYHFFSPEHSAFHRTIYLGLLISFFPLAQFFGAPIIGELSDRIGRKKSFVITILGSAIGYIFIGLGIAMQSLPLLLFSRLATGFFAGNLTICLASLVDISKDEQARTKNFGLLAAIGGLSFVISVSIGGIFSNPSFSKLFSPSLPFWMTACLFLMNFVLMLVFFQESHPVRTSSTFSLFRGVHNILSALKIKHLKRAYAIYFFYLTSWVAAMQFLPTYLFTYYDVSLQTLTLIFIGVGLTWSLVNLVINRVFARSFSPSQTLKGCLLLLSLSLVLFIFPQTLSAFLSHFFLAVAFGALCWTNTLANVSLQAPLEIQGRILGINQSFGALAALAGPIIGGFIAALDPKGVYLFSSICSFFGFILLRKHRMLKEQS